MTGCRRRALDARPLQSSCQVSGAKSEADQGLERWARWHGPRFSSGEGPGHSGSHPTLPAKPDHRAVANTFAPRMASMAWVMARGRQIRASAPLPSHRLMGPAPPAGWARASCRVSSCCLDWAPPAGSGHRRSTGRIASARGGKDRSRLPTGALSGPMQRQWLRHGLGVSKPESVTVPFEAMLSSKGQGPLRSGQSAIAASAGMSWRVVPEDFIKRSTACAAGCETKAGRPWLRQNRILPPRDQAQTSGGSEGPLAVKPDAPGAGVGGPAALLLPVVRAGNRKKKKNPPSQAPSAHHCASFSFEA